MDHPRVDRVGLCRPVRAARADGSGAPQVTRGHDHDDNQGVGPDWFAALDLLIIAAVVFIVTLLAEWLAGAMVRERITAGFRRLLKQAADQEQTAE